jgi:hypothetical protein
MDPGGTARHDALKGRVDSSRGVVEGPGTSQRAARADRGAIERVWPTADAGEWQTYSAETLVVCVDGPSLSGQARRQ